MYNFIDVNEASESVVLPSEALQINGEYIENLISGYRTLSVQGREALSPDVTTFETGVRDGSSIQGKRYPQRIIVVQYQLLAKSNEEFREAYNQLGKILNVKDAQLIFNDEQDKFFTGTPCIIGNVNPGLNSVVGEFEIVCTDPFKYSVTEYEATVAEGEDSVMIEYNGTYKAYPKLEADFYSEAEVAEDGETAGTLTGAGDCGYVAFFNEEEKIIQLGSPDEVDGLDALAESQTLMNQTFQSEYAWGTTAQGLWAVNEGHIMSTNVQQMGSVAMKSFTYKAYTAGRTSGKAVSTRNSGINYVVKYSTSNRIANAVTVALTVSATLMRSYLTPDASISATVSIGGKSYLFKLKDKGYPWVTGNTYSTSRTVIIGDLTTSQKAITGATFEVEASGFDDPFDNSVSVACNNISISAYQTTYATYALGASDYGTAQKVWHGPSITRNVPADASGEVGAANFTLTYKQRMSIGNSNSAVNQLGAFQVQLSDADGACVAGVRIHKNLSGKKASLIYYMGGVKVYGTTIDLSYSNKYFGSKESSVQTSTIVKSGGVFTFNIAGYKKVFTDAELADTKVTSVTFMFEKYSTNTALSENGLYWVKFVKNNCDTWQDIPNKFSANDVLVADCKNAEIYLNGVQSPHLGALGNDWEAFCLRPGLNQIGFAYSSWVAAEYAPTLKVRYREVFL